MIGEQGGIGDSEAQLSILGAVAVFAVVDGRQAALRLLHGHKALAGLLQAVRLPGQHPGGDFRKIPSRPRGEAQLHHAEFFPQIQPRLHLQLIGPGVEHVDLLQVRRAEARRYPQRRPHRPAFQGLEPRAGEFPRRLVEAEHPVGPGIAGLDIHQPRPGGARQGVPARALIR